MLIMLPCLREQNVIVGSIDYFSKMSLENINLYKKTNKQINQKRADIQRKIIEEYEKNSKK